MAAGRLLNIVAPTLVFGWGNASRGDDALGPLFVERLRRELGEEAGGVDFLDDYQLQPEHALDLVGRHRVLLVDASRDAAAPFAASPIHGADDASISTHALSPQALLAVYRRVQREEPPPVTLLAIRGERFELGEAPGEAALENLEAALRWARGWLARPD